MRGEGAKREGNRSSARRKEGTGGKQMIVNKEKRSEIMESKQRIKNTRIGKLDNEEEIRGEKTSYTI